MDFLQYWTMHGSMEDVIAGHRKRGMKIGTNVAIYNSILEPVYPNLITIGDNVTITHSTLLAHDDSSVIWTRRRRVAPVHVGSNVFIGMNSIILPGVHIGDDCLIGAGAIVTKNIPSGSVVVGNPARILKSIESFKKDLLSNPGLLPLVLVGNVPAKDEEGTMRELVNDLHTQHGFVFTNESQGMKSK